MLKNRFFVVLLVLAGSSASFASLEKVRQDKIDELLKLLEKPEPFKPLSDAEVKKSKAALVHATSELERQLKVIGAAQEKLWKSYLDWDELQEQIKSEKPSRTELTRIAHKYRMNHPGLEMKVFTDVREAILVFANHSYFANEALSKRIYDSRLRLIQTGLTKLKEAHDDRTVGLIGEAIADLEHSGNCPDLVARIRSAFAKPNFHFEVSERLAQSLLKERKALDSQPVYEEILGVLQRGTAHTTSRFNVDFLPSRHSGKFKLIITGNTISDQVGTKELGLLGNVYICSEGNTCLVGEAVIEFDGRKISYSDLCAGAKTNTQIKGVNTPPLLRGPTLKQIERKKDEGEAEAASRARTKFVRRIREELNGTVAKTNKKLSTGVRSTVKRLDFEPKRLEVTTSDEAFRVLAIVGNGNHLTSLVGPDSNVQGDIITQMHESSINNGLQHLLGGRTVEMQEMRNLITSFGVELSPPPEDEQPLTITFPRVRPIQVSFDKQGITTVVSANQIKSGGTVVKDELKITIKYAIDSTPDSIKVAMVDDIKIDFEGAYTNSKSVIESAIKPKLEKLFKKETREFKLSEIELPKELAEFGLPKISRLDINQGWLVAQLGLDQPRTAGLVPIRKMSRVPVVQYRKPVPVRPLQFNNERTASTSASSYSIQDRR